DINHIVRSSDHATTPLVYVQESEMCKDCLAASADGRRPLASAGQATSLSTYRMPECYHPRERAIAEPYGQLQRANTEEYLIGLVERNRFNTERGSRFIQSLSITAFGHI